MHMTLNYLLNRSETSIQLDLKAIYQWWQWAKSNDLMLNLSKFEVIHFGSKNSKCSYFLNGSEIPSVACVKNVCVLMD